MTEKIFLGKNVTIFYNQRQYRGILLYEDDVIYRVEDRMEGIVQVPKSDSVMMGGRE